MTRYINIEEIDAAADQAINDLDAKLYSKDGKEGKDDCGLVPRSLYDQQSWRLA